tara:strand:- start:3428 stop:3748 length:321 start_codon:yes stop_codon:yes gene_type:complete
MKKYTILQGAQQITRATRIKNNLHEIDCGLKINGYEDFDLNFVTDNPRHERISSYKKDNNILVFYVGCEDIVSMKVFDITKGLTKTTTFFPSIGISDIPSVIKLIN